MAGETILIPFDPPIGQDLSYRWEKSDQKDGVTTISWSVDRYRFEESKGGYRLFVEPVSSGSNEKDPKKIELMKKLEELTKQQFVLRLNDEARIAELENADEYWRKITQALREVLSAGKVDATGAKVIESVVRLFENMPAEVRLAQLTESVQPLVEFAYTETTLGKPIKASLDTQSPFGGTIKQDVVVSLTKVADGTAHLTIRSNVPRSELEKLSQAFIARLGSGIIKEGDAAKAKAAIAAMKDFKSETVADYKISIADGMLETFKSTQTTTFSGEGKGTTTRVKTVSLTRVD